MTIKYYTHNNPPKLLGEVFDKKTLTRQSDFMDIKDTIARFYKSGLLTKPVYGPLTDKEKEDMFDEITDSDIMDSDLVEQKDFVDQINKPNVPIQEENENILDKSVEEGADSPQGE